MTGNIQTGTVATGNLQERTDISTLDARTEWTYLQTATVLWDTGAEVTIEGADLQFARREDLDPLLAAELGRLAVNTADLGRNPHSTALGVFASGRWQWRKFEAEIGGRVDRQQYRGLGNHAQATPRINLRFDPAPLWHLYGSWGQFTQAQRPAEWRIEGQQTTPDPRPEPFI